MGSFWLSWAPPLNRLYATSMSNRLSSIWTLAWAEGTVQRWFEMIPLERQNRQFFIPECSPGCWAAAVSSCQSREGSECRNDWRDPISGPQAESLTPPGVGTGSQEEGVRIRQQGTLTWAWWLVTHLVDFSKESVCALDLPLTQLPQRHLLEVDLQRRTAYDSMKRR